MFKAIKISEPGLSADFTIDLAKWQEWATALADFVILNKAYRYTVWTVFGKKSAKVSIVDPYQGEYAWSTLTKQGRTLCDSFVDPFIRTWIDSNPSIKLTNDLITLIVIPTFTDALIASDEVKHILQQHALANHKETVEDELNSLVRTLSVQADEEFGVPLMFFKKNKTLYYEYHGDLYKVPKDDRDPELGNPKHLVANKFVDF